jgi:hypothetical protein
MQDFVICNKKFLLVFEKEIEWYHQKGIDDSISSLKEILSDKCVINELYE